MVSLRVITSDDWPLWQEIRVAALGDTPRAFTARLADWHDGGAEQWRARLAIPGSYNVVALRAKLRAGGAVARRRHQEAGDDQETAVIRGAAIGPADRRHWKNNGHGITPAAKHPAQSARLRVPAP
ncbi:GNAT family N-acetyltransferase [Streptomyces sp. NPDC006552]|uniref:GNAT family N-acetyltransferase n=1 Tax=Streptomyces sp. NPDC006552 TaxID=3157179 RepID=UPI0033BCDAEA